MWNKVNTSSLSSDQEEKLYKEFLKMKELKNENINTISDVWIKDKSSMIFITDSFFAGSIRQ